MSKNIWNSAFKNVLKDITKESIAEEIIKRSTISDDGKYKRRIYNNNFTSWVIWNLYNPDKKIKHGDGTVIHHKDGDTLNDNKDNLDRLLFSDHSSLHRRNVPLTQQCKNLKSISMKKFHKENPDYNKNNPWFGKKGKDSAHYGKIVSFETKQKLSEKLKERKFSIETLKRMSEAKQGEKNNRWGVKLSQEVKDKISESNKGKHNISAKARRLKSIQIKEWWKNKKIEKCSVGGCEIKHHVHGYCSKHWSRVKVYGTTNYISRKSDIGIKGVYRYNNTDKYVAKIGINKKRITLGVFSNLADAKAAYDAKYYGIYGEHINV